jgi:hypothetical protein
MLLLCKWLVSSPSRFSSMKNCFQCTALHDRNPQTRGRASTFVCIHHNTRMQFSFADGCGVVHKQPLTDQQSEAAVSNIQQTVGCAIPVAPAVHTLYTALLQSAALLPSRRCSVKRLLACG